jgi:hypothetical protein
MTDLTKILMVLAMGSVAYTLVAPGRQTPAVINATGNAFSKIMKTSQGRG